MWDCARAGKHCIQAAMSSSVSAASAASTFLSENAGVVVGVCVAIAIIVGTQVALSKAKSSADAGFLTDAYAAVPLTEKTIVSHNTRLFRFALPTEATRLGLPLGRHMFLRAVIDGNEMRRPYTPTSSDNDLGYFDLLVKVYPAPGGKMSRHLDSLAVGDTIDVKGPLGKFSYAQNSFRKIGMIAGGTGITPCWQVFRELLADPEDKTEISLIFANVKVDDILLHKELNAMAVEHDRFKVYFVLNEAPEGWTGGVGYVTADMIASQIGEPADDTMICHCGPLPMNKAVKTHLIGMGFKDSQIFKF